MFVAPAGSKVGYTLEEVVWQNIYATTETDIDTIESMFFKAPDMLVEHQKQWVLDNYDKHQEDRDDFDLMLKDIGWSAEDIETVSKYRGDCIPFPYGNYSVAPSDSPIQGRGLFATADIQAGTMIAAGRVGGKRTPAGYLINHSKNPNCKAVTVPNGDMYIVAEKDIKGMLGGDLVNEITLDYRQVVKENKLLLGNN
jgi:hypothetical protein